MTFKLPGAAYGFYERSKSSGYLPTPGPAQQSREHAEGYLVPLHTKAAYEVSDGSTVILRMIDGAKRWP